MKTTKNIIILSTIVILFACQTNRPDNAEINGKWWSYNISETEYCEYDIDKDSIGSFSHYTGNFPRIDYNIDNDTLYYLNGKFIINMISKNQFSLTNGNATDTLTRLPDSIITFHTIDYHNDSVFDLFYIEFQKRAYDCWVKYGYVTEEELRNSFIEKKDIKEEIILMNKK